MLEGVGRLQAHGLEVSAGFILGFDSDPEDIFERQIRFIQEAAIPTAMVGLLTALPRTRLARRLQEEGRLLGASEGDNTHDLRLNFRPRMDAGTLLAGYKRVLARVYDPEQYFARCLRLLKALKPHPGAFRTIRPGEVLALFRSLLVQGFSSYAWTYWRFLLKGLAANPLRLADLVTMAVKGHHYFQMTQNMLELDRFKVRLEDLASAFEARAKVFSSRGGLERLVELTRYRNRIVGRMRRSYKGLHLDFRIYADQPAALLQARMDAALTRLSG
jgi:hypothetical protein